MAYTNDKRTWTKLNRQIRGASLQFGGSREGFVNRRFFGIARVKFGRNDKLALSGGAAQRDWIEAFQKWPVVLPDPIPPTRAI